MRQQSNKTKSIKKMWWIIIFLWIFSIIFCQPIFSSYYLYVINHLDLAISHVQKIIYITIPIILWVFSLIVFSIWIILLRSKRKKEPPFSLVIKYLFSFGDDLTEEETSKLDPKYLKYLKSKLNQYSSFLNTMALLYTIFIVASLASINTPTLHMFLLIGLSIVLLWIPSYICLYFLIKYRQAQFTTSNTIIHNHKQ